MIKYRNNSSKRGWALAVQILYQEIAF